MVYKSIGMRYRLRVIRVKTDTAAGSMIALTGELPRKRAGLVGFIPLTIRSHLARVEYCIRAMTSSSTVPETVPLHLFSPLHFSNISYRPRRRIFDHRKDYV